MITPLFENHLAFLRSHRGTLIKNEDCLFFKGYLPALSFWTPLGPRTQLMDSEVVWIGPWSGSGWQIRLNDVGFKVAQTLNYMTAEHSPGFEPNLPEVRIIRASSVDEARCFAEAQAEGFLTTGDTDVAWWKACFLKSAIANVAFPNQHFYVAFVDQDPVATTLMFESNSVAGIYAVSTKPKYRHKGIARSLLRTAWNDARDLGYRQLSLQTVSNSFAHALYQRSGFSTSFVSQHFVREGSRGEDGIQPARQNS